MRYDISILLLGDRRNLVKGGVAALAGALGVGLATARDRLQLRTERNLPTIRELTGRNWHLSNPARAAGELPARGDQMMLYGADPAKAPLTHCCRIADTPGP
jgi:hypothetical protein